MYPSDDFTLWVKGQGKYLHTTLTHMTGSEQCCQFVLVYFWDVCVYAYAYTHRDRPEDGTKVNLFGNMCSVNCQIFIFTSTVCFMGHLRTWCQFIVIKVNEWYLNMCGKGRAVASYPTACVTDGVELYSYGRSELNSILLQFCLQISITCTWSK